MGLATISVLKYDCVAFAQLAGIEPDPWQVKVLTSTSPRLLLNCCRQSGKSTIVAVLAAHTATYQKGSLTLIVSPTERQSAETLLKVREVLAAVDWPERATAEGETHLTLANGSRVIALPGGSEGTVRGYSAVTLLLVDEAARVSDSLMAALAPSLAVSGGRIIELSTPWGARGHFYAAWMSAPPEQKVEAPASECSRISAEFLADERRERGQWHYEQEFFCQFKEAEAALFREEDIQALFHPELEKWNILS